MQCYICGSEMRTEKRTVTTSRKGRTVIHSAPVWVCPSCGEEAYEPDTVRDLQQAAREAAAGGFVGACG